MAVALGVSDIEMWRRVDAEGAAFWATLEPHPWTEELWRRAKATAPTILLTTPSQHSSSLAGKLQWMDRFLGAPFRDFLIGPRKEFCASDGVLLIDDRESNCRKFFEAGGSAQVFPRPWNEMWKLDKYRSDPMAIVDGWLVP